MNLKKGILLTYICIVFYCCMVPILTYQVHFYKQMLLLNVYISDSVVV